MNVRIYRADELPDINRREIFRYAGTSRPTHAEEALLDACLGELLPSLTYRVAWAEFPVTTENGALNLGFTVTQSADLIKNLRGHDRIVLFAATLGFSPDRLTMRYGHSTPVRALFLEAVGNERIEALCDTFCGQFSHRCPRFSPGYGDFSLAHQREILAALDCQRTIGLTLNQSLLLSPSKSVTAVMGIESPETARYYEPS